jgi:hypothetical protein
MGASRGCLLSKDIWDESSDIRVVDTEDSLPRNCEKYRAGFDIGYGDYKRLLVLVIELEGFLRAAHRSHALRSSIVDPGSGYSGGK